MAEVAVSMTKEDELIQLMIDMINKGGDFLNDQAPLIFQETIISGRIFSTSIILIFSCLMLFFLYMFYKMVKYQQKNYVNSREENVETEQKFLGIVVEEDVIAPMIVISFIGFVIAGLVFLANFYTFILVWFAPRLYLLNTIT